MNRFFLLHARVRRTAALAGFAFLISTTPALAQEFRGAITGTVTDAQAAAVAGAAVAATHIETNTVTKTTTNASGTYALPYLAVGHYNIAVSAPGFKRELRNSVEMRVGDRVQLDFSLEL